jgi:N-acetylglucosaminyl-diphospho-decaprenol L-rhamnosyltransferase
MVDLAAVIVSYDVRDLLQGCLGSIERSATRLRLDVWVVDSGSSDGTPTMIREKFPWVHLIESENIGFSRGNNLALRQILADAQTGDLPRFVLLLNPDTELPTTALSNMVDFLEAHPEAGVVGPKLVRNDGSLDLACRRSFPSPGVSFFHFVGLGRIFPRSRIFGRYNLTYLDPDEISEVDSVVGAFMLVRGEILRTVGLLDEEFFLYGEDLDWALRIKKAGWKVLYNGAVSVFHLKRASSRQRSTQSLIAFHNAMLIFFRKHYAADTAAPVRWLVVLAIYLRAAIALAYNGSDPRELARLHAIR